MRATPRTFRQLLPWVAATLLVLVTLIVVFSRGRSGGERQASTIASFDHVRILVRDISATRSAYRDSLGFSFPEAAPDVFDEGSAHDLSELPDGSYLELVGIADRAKLEAVRPWIVHFLETQEGAHSIGLLVPSAKALATRLQSRGVTAPIFNLTRSGSEDPPVLLVTPQMESLPAGAIFFLEYPPGEIADPDVKPPPQTNTTEQLVAVWLVVRDLTKATADLERLGFRLTRSARSTALAADVREFATQRGVIVLLSPTGNGPAAQFQSSRGDGVMGFTLAAADLTQARTLIERTTGRRLETYRGLYGTSFLIPAELAAGAWIEIAQR